MYIIDLNRTAKIHFIGIGGISMSGIAELFHSKGFQVSGSDLVKTTVTEHLESLGIQIVYEQLATSIPQDAEIIVYTAAVHEDNPEFIEAKRRNLPMLDRAECLGQIMSHYKNAVAVAGTHGKTTTTSMLSYVYLEGELDPTISVGGILPAISGNLRIGSSEHFIMEACEYADSFLKFTPTSAILLNVEAEHLDYFKTLENERESYTKFIALLPKNALLVLHDAIEDKANLIRRNDLRVVTYGIDEAHLPRYSASNITYNSMGHPSYDLYIDGNFVTGVNLSVTGEHNVLNSLAVIASAHEPSELEKEGLPLDIILSGIGKYTGTERRFQYKGERDGYTIIDDYAHHPTEIASTLMAARRVNHSRLVLVFQPHLYSRTTNFLQEFIEVLSHVDMIVLADIYAAREENPGNITSEAILNGLLKKGVNAHYFGSFSEIEAFLAENCQKGDLVITMGAGDIFKVGEHLLQ